MKRLGAIAAVVATICGASAHADQASVGAALGRRPVLSTVGLSSYYGAEFHGRRTADGEIFDMRGLSAAHKSLPIPCYARVTNLHNGHSVIVRVNDRGPFVAGRMLDVSERAARLLGFNGGLERVRLDYLGKAGPAGADDQRALLASLRTGAEPVAVAKANPADEDGVSVAVQSSPALAFASAKPRAPAAAALDAVRAPSQAAPAGAALGLASHLDASVRRLEAALDTTHRVAEGAARTLSPYGDLVLSPFKRVIAASQ